MALTCSSKIFLAHFLLDPKDLLTGGVIVLPEELPGVTRNKCEEGEDDEDDAHASPGEDSFQSPAKRKRYDGKPQTAPSPHDPTPVKRLAPGLGEVRDHEQHVIVKYTNDCWDRRIIQGSSSRSEHPLVLEYKFMKIFGPNQISPNAYFLSHPAVLPARASVERRSTRHLSGYLKKDERYDECVRVGTQVRFLVQEWVGVTWSDYSAFLRKRLSAIPQPEVATVHVSQTDPNELAVAAVMIQPEETENEKVSKELIILEIKIAKKAFQLVRGLHKLGFVHGDFHSGNIAFRNPNLSFEDIGKDMDSLDEMILIDFGLAKEFRYDAGSSLEESDASIKDLNPILLSPWQLLGQRRSPRDDVFRVLEALAYNLNPASLKSFSQQLGQMKAIRDLTLRTTEQLKLNERIIAHKTSSSMFGGSQAGWVDLRIDTRELQNMLNEIMTTFILSLDHPDAVPDYQSINREFDTVIEFLKN